MGYKADVLNIIQRKIGRIIIYKTGYGPFVSYLQRFGKKGTPTYSYGAPQEPQHISYYPELTGHR